MAQIDDAKSAPNQSNLLSSPQPSPQNSPVNGRDEEEHNTPFSSRRRELFSSRVESGSVDLGQGMNSTSEVSFGKRFFEPGSSTHSPGWMVGDDNPTKGPASNPSSPYIVGDWGFNLVEENNEQTLNTCSMQEEENENMLNINDDEEEQFIQWASARGILKDPLATSVIGKGKANVEVLEVHSKMKVTPEDEVNAAWFGGGVPSSSSAFRPSLPVSFRGLIALSDAEAYGHPDRAFQNVSTSWTL